MFVPGIREKFARFKVVSETKKTVVSHSSQIVALGTTKHLSLLEPQTPAILIHQKSGVV